MADQLLDSQQAPAGVDDFLGNALSPETANAQAQIEYNNQLEARSGGIGQQALAGVEHVAQGLIGPLAPLVEHKYLGVPYKDIRDRAEANPGTSALGEAAGFILPALLTGGESAVAKGSLSGIARGVGEAVSAPIGKGLVQTGVRTGAELAALQTSDELTKKITQDPNWTVASAASNVGMAALIGGLGGVALSGAGKAIGKGLESAGIGNFIDDAKGQYALRQAHPDFHGDVLGELQNRIDELGSTREGQGAIKLDALSRAMPEVSVKASAGIDRQVAEVVNTLQEEAGRASDNAFLKGKAGYLDQLAKDFEAKVSGPDSTYLAKFNALDELKRGLQDLGNYSLTAEDSAFGKVSKGLAANIRERLEDSRVWGEAGNIQKNVNKAVTSNIAATTDFEKRFTSIVGNKRVLDPGKVQTYLNQSAGSRAGIKSNIIYSYLEKGEGLVKALNEAQAGFGQPLQGFSPTPLLDHTLNRVTPGAKFANWLYDKGISALAGNAAAEGVGGALGAVGGHPVLGAVLGKWMFGAPMKALAKPLLEQLTHSASAAKAIDYALAAAKGEAQLSKAAKAFFEPGAAILTKEAIDHSDLTKAMDGMDDFNKSLGVGKDLQHYMPEHATSLATAIGTAKQYLDTLKPPQSNPGPFGSVLPANKGRWAAYNRAAGIIENPLMILKYGKEGTLTQQDVTTLSTVYPQYLKGIADTLVGTIADRQGKGLDLTASQRHSLGLLLGVTPGPTNTSTAMQTAMMANAPREMSPTSPRGGRQGSSGRATNVELKQVNKVNDLYLTPLQRRASTKNAK